MQPLVNLTAILKLADTCDALVPVSEPTWKAIKTLWPQHCYGCRHSAELPVMFVPHHYRVDILGLLMPVFEMKKINTESFSNTYDREAVAVTKDQWLAISQKPQFREFCFGGESKSVIARKAWMSNVAPHAYAEWKHQLLALLQKAKPFDNTKYATADGPPITLFEKFNGEYLVATLDLVHCASSMGISLDQHGKCLDFAVKQGAVEEVSIRGHKFLRITERQL